MAIKMQCCVCYKIKTDGEWKEMSDPHLIFGTHGYCQECRKKVEREINLLVAEGVIGIHGITEGE